MRPLNPKASFVVFVVLCCSCWRLAWSCVFLVFSRRALAGFLFFLVGSFVLWTRFSCSCPGIHQEGGLRRQGPRAPFSLLASSSSTEALCNDPLGRLQLHARPRCNSRPTRRFPDTINDDSTWHPGGLSRKRRYLSNWCDAHTQDTLMTQSTQTDRITLRTPPGPWGWTSPYFDRDPDLVRMALQHHHRIPSLPNDTHCPLCGQVMDCLATTPAVCPCAGDRNRRRPSVFDEAAQEGGFYPQKERAGLQTDGLPQRASPLQHGVGKTRLQSLGFCGCLLLSPTIQMPWPVDRAHP